jgi:hypothetical protein
MHGIAYDPVHDETVVPVNLAGAVLVFLLNLARFRLA